MHLAWKNLFLYIFWIICTVRLSSGCIPEPGIVELINDSWDSQTPIWSEELEGAFENDFRFEINEDGYDHSRAFTFVIEDLGGGRFRVDFMPGPEFSDYVDIVPRLTATNVKFFYTCDAAPKESTAILTWIDRNTRAPEFVVDSTKLTFPIKTNWDKNIPLNWGVPFQVSDADYSFINANASTFTISSSVDGEDILDFEVADLWEVGDPIPSQYLSDVKVFIKNEYELKEGDVDIDITVSDGIHPSSSITITLQITSAGQSSPQFTEPSYYHKLSTWPDANSGFEPSPPILAEIIEEPGAIFQYSLSSTDLSFDSETIPRRVNFNRAISHMDGKQVMIVHVTATKVGTSLSATTSLIIEFPPVPNLEFLESEFKKDVEWYDGATPQEVLIENVITNLDTTSGEQSTFSIDSIYPAVINPSHIEIDPSEGNSIRLTLTDITEDLPVPNGVVLVKIVAKAGAVELERTAPVTVALYFPVKLDTTTEPTQTTTECPTTWTTETTECPTATTDAGTCPPCSTESSSCPTSPTTCEPITPDPSAGTCPPPTCPPCEEECPSPSTSNPSTSTCAPCETTIFTTECPTESTTCPSCEDYTPTTGSTAESTTCPTCEECSYTPGPTTVSCAPCPSTAPPPTQCPTTPTCAPCNECPLTPDPSTGTCAPCPTTQSPIPSTPCPVTTCPPPPTPCPTTPTCAPCNECPLTPDPSTGTCAPCPTTQSPIPSTPCPVTTCPVTTCPVTTCPVTTCPPPSGECPPTPAPCQDQDEDDCSNTGLLAGIAVVSVLFAASLGAAGFLFWKLKNVPTSSFPSSSYADKPPAAHNPRHSFAQPGSMRGGGDFEEDKGWVNPAFSGPDPTASNVAGLEQVLTHPEPSTSVAAFSPSPPAVSPYMTSPIVPDPVPMKSSLAKPKEIAPDYEEGLGKSPPPSTAAKAKPGGVKIADQVEIINHDTDNLIPDSDGDESERL